MTDYISREAANEACREAVRRYPNSFYNGIEAARDAIRKLPAADVREAVSGKWIWDDEGYHCSECFYHAYGETGEVLSGNWHFCPNCGADMREATDG